MKLTIPITADHLALLNVVTRGSQEVLDALVAMLLKGYLLDVAEGTIPTRPDHRGPRTAA